MIDKESRGQFEMTSVGRVLGSLISVGPATTRQLADRLATSLGVDSETYWVWSARSLEELLHSELGRVNYFNGVWSIATGPDE